jgi:hypothetical protein
LQRTDDLVAGNSPDVQGALRLTPNPQLFTTLVKQLLGPDPVKRFVHRNIAQIGHDFGNLRSASEPIDDVVVEATPQERPKPALGAIGLADDLPLQHLKRERLHDILGFIAQHYTPLVGRSLRQSAERDDHQSLQGFARLACRINLLGPVGRPGTPG